MSHGKWPLEDTINCLNIFVIAEILMLLFCASLATIWYYQNYSNFFKKLSNIPGPPGLPVFGHTFLYAQPMDKLFADFRVKSRRYYPIYKEYAFNVGVVSILSPEDLQIVLSSMKHISKAKVYKFLHPWLGTGLLTSTGEKWQSRRKILTPAFHFTILKEFVESFNAKAEKVLGNLEVNSTIDVVPLVAEFTLDSITETAMGINLDTSSEKYKKALFQLGDIISNRVVRPWLHIDFLFGLTQKGFSSRRILKVLHEFTRDIIAKRRKDFHDFEVKKKPAMLDLLLSAQQNGANIDDEGIREEVDTFTFEGHDTVAISLSGILLTLANHRKEQNEVRREILEVLGDRTPTYEDLQRLPFTERCVKECARLYPAVPFIAREAEVDISTATGYIIPKGATIAMHIYDIHRNPEIYPDPEKFDPDRFLPENVTSRHPFAYIPFSAGPRNCIGQKFAILELKAFLCWVLRRFVLEPVTKREDVVFFYDLVLRPKNEVYVKFLPRE